MNRTTAEPGSNRICRFVVADTRGVVYFEQAGKETDRNE